eukprot:1160727-Pelagomonas_calceolata.AAC.23
MHDGFFIRENGALDPCLPLVACCALVSVLYLVFPFFTYVPTSGKLGKELPQVRESTTKHASRLNRNRKGCSNHAEERRKVMFFGRIFADIVGRFAPRRKALMVRAPMALLTLGGIKTLDSMYAQQSGNGLKLVAIWMVWVVQQQQESVLAAESTGRHLETAKSRHLSRVALGSSPGNETFLCPIFCAQACLAEGFLLKKWSCLGELPPQHVNVEESDSGGLTKRSSLKLHVLCLL